MFTSSFIDWIQQNIAFCKLRKTRLALICIIFLFSSIYKISAQPLLFPSNHKRYIIKTINIENGLKNNTVNDVVTDTFGFTWVATKTGLQRYNGYRLENVQPVINGVKRNIDYQVYFLQTQDKNIWIACHEGILQYNPFLDSFTEVIHYPTSSDPFAFRPVEDTRQGIWCAGKRELVLYSYTGKALRKISYPDTLTCAQDLQFCSAFNNRYLFLLTDKSRVLTFNKESGSFSLLQELGEPVIKLSVAGNRLYLLHQQGITFYKENNGAFSLVHSFVQNCRFPGTIKAFADGVMASIDHHLLSFNPDCTQVSEIATVNGGPFTVAISLTCVQSGLKDNK